MIDKEFQKFINLECMLRAKIGPPYCSSIWKFWNTCNKIGRGVDKSTLEDFFVLANQCLAEIDIEISQKG